MTGQQFAITAFVVTWLTASLRLAGPVLLAALGETFAEQSGVLNIGIEGTILLGALTSFLVCYYTGMIWISLFAAVLVGIAANTLLAWMYVTVRASQVVAGLVFNVLALGVASAGRIRAAPHVGQKAEPAVSAEPHFVQNKLNTLRSFPLLR